MFALVVHVKVYLVTVVVNAVVPVLVQSEVPAALFRLSFARGNIVPTFAVLLIQRLKVTVEAAGMTPDVLGTPACVSKALTMYSPVASPFRFAEVRAVEAASGPAVFN
jgi:hypothetical protein